MSAISSIAAHNPLSARYNFEAGSLASELTINLSQDGINQALLQAYPRDVLEQLSRREFEELIVAYVKNNFKLFVDGQALELGQGGIKSGDHQTDLRFVLPAYEEQVAMLAVEITAFQENDHHQTIFSYSINDKSGHEILRENNYYRTTIYLQPQVMTTNYIFLPLIVGTALLLGFLANWRIRKGNNVKARVNEFASGFRVNQF